MAYKAIVTGPGHGSVGFNSETQIVSLDYEYGVINGVPYSVQVKVYFPLESNPSQIEIAVKDAIIADVLLRYEDVIGQNDIKIL